MTHVAKLWLKNYGPFRGEHELELGPGVYAVTARYEADEERSNWGGKSTLLSAIPYALFGWHLHRTEDEAITEGEDEVAVMITLSNGATATRSRRRGKSTQLGLTQVAGKAPVVQTVTCGGAQAETELAALVGLSDEDFFSTCYFRQKEASRLVTMLPSQRMQKFNAWFELDLGERCIDNAGERQAKAQEQVDQLEARRAALAEQLEDIGRAYPGDGELAARLEQVQLEAEREAAAALEAYDQARKAEQLEADREEFKRIDAEGRARRAEHDAIAVPELEPLQVAYDDACRAKTLSELELDEARQLETGGFDGTCPVTQEQCPARAHVEAQAGAIARRFEAAAQAHDAARDEVEKTAEPLRRAREQQRQKERIDVQIKSLAERARALKAKLKGAPRGQAPGHAEARERAQAAQRRAADVASHRAQHAKATERLAQIDQELAQARLAAQAAAMGGEVLRRAQRAVARQRAGGVEQGANELLRAAGIELGIELRWEQEAKGLAAACGQCGRGFPKSGKAKQCACGAARQPKTIDKPNFVLSSVSGAAEDIAGVALQLAASRYLRTRRGAAWSVACIDEPFGALDAANRRALAAHLVAMLSGAYGFQQAFVTAHQPDVLDAIPNRVEIIAGPNGSRLCGS